MSFRTGLLIGFGIGYVLGARAGRERYEQIADLAKRFSETGFVQSATDKGRAAADQAVQQVRDTVSEKLHGASDKVREAVEGE
jgi:hypothetical protein